jgi:hypothetical protein
MVAASTLTALTALATSAVALPSTLDVTGAAMIDPTYVTFSNAATPDVISYTVEDAPLTLTFADGPTLLAFCVDIWHNIDLGSVQTNYSKSDLVYQKGALTTDSSGAATGTGNILSTTQIGEVGGLVNLGEALDKAGDDPNLAIDLSAIQAAIWAIINPSMVVAAAAPTGPDGAPLADQDTSAVASELNTQIAYYKNVYAPANQSMAFTTYFDTADNTQGLAIPEPAGWALMLVGFGGLGGRLRAGRRRVRA